MVSKPTIQAGLDQMDFEIVDDGHLKLPASTPARYVFASETELDPEAVELELDDYDFSILTPNHQWDDDGSFYYYVDVVTDHYKKIHVKVWQDRANLYPKEELVDTYEVSRIIHAIENAFGTELVHIDPAIEQKQNV